MCKVRFPVLEKPTITRLCRKAGTHCHTIEGIILRRRNERCLLQQCELINVYKELGDACTKGILKVNIFKGTSFCKAGLRGGK